MREVSVIRGMPILNIVASALAFPSSGIRRCLWFLGGMHLRVVQCAGRLMQKGPAIVCKFRQPALLGRELWMPRFAFDLDSKIPMGKTSLESSVIGMTKGRSLDSNLLLKCLKDQAAAWGDDWMMSEPHQYVWSVIGMKGVLSKPTQWFVSIGDMAPDDKVFPVESRQLISGCPKSINWLKISRLGKEKE